MKTVQSIAFQGMRGAYSEQACREYAAGCRVFPCRGFEEVFLAVEEGQVDLGMIPVENNVAGVIADSYDLLAVHRLHVVGEHYLLVRHCLLGLPSVVLSQVQVVRSHPQALAQCSGFIKQNGWNRQSVYDTAGAAAELLERGRPEEAAIASELCSQMYGLDCLARDIQDSQINTTRFLIVAREPLSPPEGIACKTSLLFEVRNIPASLYKCLGGFATNGINLTRLESRPVAGKPWAYHFYLDFQGRPDEARGRLALEELSFFTNSLKILGCYPEAAKPMEERETISC